jgi:oligopeptide transport system substrate-binding protein
MILRYLPLLLSALLLAGCSDRVTPAERGIRDGVLLIGNGGEPRDLDPQTNSSTLDGKILLSIYEPLVRNHPETLEPIPASAESWTISDDGLIYTFIIREGAQWSNGDPLTAHDFVYAFRRLFNPDLGAELAFQLYPILGSEAFNKGEATAESLGVRALDDRRLEIELQAPTPHFFDLISGYLAVPVHPPTVERFGGPTRRGAQWGRPENFVGNGPFVLTAWRPNQVIVAKKNPLFWDAERNRLNEVRFFPIDSRDTEERAFRAGQLHVTATVPLALIDRYRRNQPEVIRLDPYFGVYFLQINNTQPPLDDPRVRRALAMAIDRNSLVTNVTRGGEQPAYHFSFPGAGGLEQEPWFSYDPEGARRLLAEAGFPNGQGFPRIDYSFNTSEAHRSLAEAIQQMWRVELGIEARLSNQEWQSYLASLRAGSFQVGRLGWIGGWNDADTFLQVLESSSPSNYSRFSDAEFDRLLAEAGRTGDRSERLQRFARMEQILAERVPVIPLYFYTLPHLVHPAVRNWPSNILDYRLHHWVYLEAPES